MNKQNERNKHSNKMQQNERNARNKNNQVIAEIVISSQDQFLHSLSPAKNMSLTALRCSRIQKIYVCTYYKRMILS